MRLWVVALVGCYNAPELVPCVTACGIGGACPDNFTCGGNGYCRLDGMADCSPGDAAIGGEMVDTTCLGAGFVKVCFPIGMQFPDETVTSGGIDTTFDAQCTFKQPQLGFPDAPELCVRVRNRFTIDAGVTWSPIGGRPLVIVATEDLTINGTLDVASTLTKKGAGIADGSLCRSAMPGAPEPAMISAGSGGGAGGALTTGGGNGGNGTNVPGGGPTMPVPMITFVRGGCAGGAGGSKAGSSGAVAGNGGGAVYLISRTRILVDGTINASGAGGGQAVAFAGGAGGGSGGFIGLDAPEYTIGTNARMFASGGGGSAGGGTATFGDPGLQATRNMDAEGTVGTGGGGSSGGADSSTNGGTGVSGTGGGGGGGGGGAGFVGVANEGKFPVQGGIVVRPRQVPMP